MPISRDLELEYTGLLAAIMDVQLDGAYPYTFAYQRGVGNVYDSSSITIQRDISRAV
ncbi:MAG: hypothetical protein AB1714_03145 [Acidobacteriota bacterium]